MNKKVYLQPQVLIISTVVESLLLGNSKTEPVTGSNVGETVKGPEGGGSGGAGELSKEHWGCIDEWDSWE